MQNKLDIAFEDLGEREVKNIARPIRTYRIITEGASVSSSTQTIAKKNLRPPAVALVIILILGGGLCWWQPWVESVEPSRPDKIAHALPDKPSIAILPFANLSGNKEQEFLADGFTEDLITNVAQSKELFVIARNSTFSYKGRKVKVRQVAEELGVRYVLEGSIRRIGENFRIIAQLIDATNGAHVWAKRYDEPVAKLFDVQDKVSREIAGTLFANINRADIAKASQKRPKDLSAYEYMLRARVQAGWPGKKAKLEARALAERAIAIDSNYAAAYAIVGETFNIGHIGQWGRPDSLERAYELARKAVELDPLLPSAQELLGRVLLRRGQHDDAMIAIKRAIALNPNRSRHYATLADALTFANRPEEAIELMKKAMRLDPFYPPSANMYLGRAYYFAKQYERAVTELKTCALRVPKWRACQMYLAPTYAELGKLADAKRAVDTLLKISPKFSIKKSVLTHLPFVPAAMQFYVDGLRKAGASEG